MSEVRYSQGMTNVWSDGEKVSVINNAGIKYVKTNIEQIFGMGEWEKLQSAIYFEVDNLMDHSNRLRKYECVSGYIPQRVVDDLAEELPEEEVKRNALEALRDE
jgi:hypothetical protein